MRSRRRSRVAVSLIVAGLSWPSVAGAANRTWFGTTNNSWQTTTNWSGFLQPGSADVAVFPRFADADFQVPVTRTAVTLSASSTVASLNVSDPANAGGYTFGRANNAVLSVTGGADFFSDNGVPHPLTLNGFHLTAASASLNDSVETTLQAGANFTVLGTLTGRVFAKTFVNNATLDASQLAVADFAQLAIGSGGLAATDDLTLLDTAVVTVNAGGTLALRAGTDHDVLGGTLNVSGGSLSMAPSSTLSVRGANSKLNFSGSHALANQAALDVFGGGDVLVAGFFDVGNGNQSTLSVDDAGSTFAAGGLSDWGRGTAGKAFVNIAGGSVSVDRLRIGTSDGEADAQLGFGGSLGVAGTLEVGGGSRVRPADLSIFDTGGTISVNGPATFNERGRLVVFGGNANFNAGATFNSGANLIWIGGDVNVPGRTLTVNGGHVAVTAGGRQLSASATLDVRNGGTFTSTGFYDVGTGLVVVDGANSRFAVGGTALTDFGRFAGQSATVTIRDGGALEAPTSGLRLGSAGTALLNVTGDARVTAKVLIAGGNASSNATINVSGGGIVEVADAITLGRGARVALDATTSDAGVFGTPGTLDMAGDARITTAGSDEARIVAGALTMSGTSRIELSPGGVLVVAYQGPSPAAALRGLIATGYDGGDWAGDRIVSLAALADPRLRLGYFDEAGDAAIFVGNTLAGDTNGDRAVGFDDLVALAQNYNGTGKFWQQGDFDYDGVVGFPDLVALAQNYNASLGLVDPLALGAGSDFAADLALAQALVPEPTAAALVVAAVAVPLSRRRRSWRASLL